MAAWHDATLCVHKMRHYGHHFHTQSNYFLHSVPVSELDLGPLEDEEIPGDGGGGESR